MASNKKTASTVSTTTTPVQAPQPTAATIDLAAMTDAEWKAHRAKVAEEQKRRRTNVQPAFAIGVTVKVTNAKDPHFGKSGPVVYSTPRQTVVELEGKRIQKAAKNLELVG